MQASGHRHPSGVITQIYYLDAGEMIDWHQHDIMHTTSVSRGRSQVDLANGTSFEMKINDRDYELPPNIQHRITALEDDTVVVHMIQAPTSNNPKAGQLHGGVLLATGEIVYD